MENIQIFQDLKTLNKEVADRFVQETSKAIDQIGYFVVALTGGNTVKGLYELLSHPPYADQVNWGRGLFFWGDERVVPPDHPESNYGQAYHLLLSRVALKPENVFRIRGEINPREAAEDYIDKLRGNAAIGLEWPRFDIVLLGMGSDGHIASIFPGEITDVERSSPVIVTSANYQGRPGERVTLTPMVFNSAKHVYFLVAGKSKAEALRAVLSDEVEPEKIPASRIQPREGEITWFVDKDAASLLEKHLL